MRLDGMETHSLRLYLSTALKEHEIRRACTAVEHILRAADILDDLHPVALEQVRDYCSDYIKGRHDTFSEFKHAYINMVGSTSTSRARWSASSTEASQARTGPRTRCRSSKSSRNDSGRR